MGNITQGNISFTVNVTESIAGFGTKRTHSSIVKNNSYNITTKQALINGGYEEYGGYSINAIDIDWNAVELPNSNTTTGGKLIIKNSGELLNLINKIQQEIYILTDIIFNKL